MIEKYRSEEETKTRCEKETKEGKRRGISSVNDFLGLRVGQSLSHPRRADLDRDSSTTLTRATLSTSYPRKRDSLVENSAMVTAAGYLTSNKNTFGVFCSQRLTS